MTHYTTLSNNLKRSVLHFSERISKGFNRPEFKFISQMIYGLLSGQSCHLSNIGRALDETIKIKKTIERLSRNLSAFTKWDMLLNNYVRKVRGCLSNKAILIIDDSDIIKPCSTKMEGLAKVRDGSTGEYGMGYHMLDVAALTPEHKSPIPVYTRVYSAEEEGFISADDEVLKALEFLRTYFARNNIRAFDRGFDANIYYLNLLAHKEKFIIRTKVNRNVIYKDKVINILELAKKFKGKFILEYQKKNGKKAECKISIIPVRLPCYPNVELNLVVELHIKCG